MKKMNFRLGLIGKVLLPVFFIIGLFLLSTQANAQSSTENFIAKVKLHVKALPETFGVTFPTAKLATDKINNPKNTNESKLYLEKRYGQLVLDIVTKSGVTDGKVAIDKAYDIIVKKVPATYVNPVRQKYLNLL